MIKPQTAVPPLSLPTLDGGPWTLNASKPSHFTFLFFYRGYHCPICKNYLRSIQQKLEPLDELGISAVAISSDTQERAQKSRDEWGIDRLPMAYGLSIDEARSWGLYVSRGINAGEPERFSEPGLFVVEPDGTLFAASIQTMPFTRPAIQELLAGFSYIVNQGYPARGEA
ncbi:MAG: peroxiredoxin-like family protein [Planctomycetota bacterium]